MEQTYPSEATIAAINARRRPLGVYHTEEHLERKHGVLYPMRYAEWISECEADDEYYRRMGEI